MSSNPQRLRILIVRLGAMGDILHALPAVTALRAKLPESWIGWAIEPQWAALLRAASAPTRGPQMPVVDWLHDVPAKRWARNPLAPSTLRQIMGVRSALREQHYDLCIDLQGAVRSAWIGRMAGTPRIIGEAEPREPLSRRFFDERVATTGVHVIQQAREVVAAALAKALGTDLPNCTARLPVDAKAEQWCDTWLASHGLDRFVLMNPGAGWGAKCWPAERYAAVAQEFARMGYGTVVNVGPGETSLAKIICDSDPRAFPMDGTLGQLIACTKRASLFIGGDTGPLHLAAALQVPVIGIYGPTDPARNGPFETTAKVLRHPASKRDHSRRSEPESGLLTITVDEVMDAARQLLQMPENSPRLGLSI